MLAPKFCPAPRLKDQISTSFDAAEASPILPVSVLGTDPALAVPNVSLPSVSIIAACATEALIAIADTMATPSHFLADLFFIYFPLGLLQDLTLAANSKIDITDNKIVLIILLKRVS